jgi:hypothetical protein
MGAASSEHDPSAQGSPSLRAVEVSAAVPDLVGTGAGGGAGDAGPSVALAVLQALADQELTRAEHARERCRQAFALAAAFFAVVQTVAFGSAVQKAISHPHLTVLVHRAELAGFMLGAAAVTLLIATAAFPTRDLTPQLVIDTVNSAADSQTLTEDFVELYAAVVNQRRQTNKWRSVAVAISQLLALGAIAAVNRPGFHRDPVV